MNRLSIRLLVIIFAIIAFIVLGVSFYEVYRKPDTKEDKPPLEEVVEVVTDKEGTPSGRQDNKQSSQTSSQNGQPTKEAFQAVAKEEITAYIKEIWGDNADFGIALAMCESSLIPTKVSPSGKYVGLYQYSQLTFDTNCDGVRENWQDQTVCTKKLIDKGEYSRWPNCP